MSDARQDGSALSAFCHKLELPVKALHDLHDSVADQDDRSGFDNVSLSTLKHGNACSLQARDLIFRKLDDEK